MAIAVLPFSDLSPSKDQDYLCEGMAEEIRNALVRVEGIRVASRTSAFRASQEEKDLAAIGRMLSVDHVLEGSVRTAGNRLRVTAQLSEVTSGYQLSSERFDRELEDIFAVQDEIAAGVVEAVKTRLAPGARTIQARPQPRNLGAYRSYLLGQHLRYAKEDYAGAIRAFQEAVRLDPAHAPSWTGIAEGLVLSAWAGLIPAVEGCAEARKALATAADLQGESADGLHGEAFVAMIERRWEDLETTVRRALELQPTHVPSLGLLGMCLSIQQRPGRGRARLRARPGGRSARLLPVHADGARAAVRREAAGSPPLRRAGAHLREGRHVGAELLEPANVALGHFEEGIAAAQHAVALSHGGPHFVGLLGWALATAGRKDEARARLGELRALPAGAPAVVAEGWLLGALGEIDAAFEVFARAEDEYQGWLVCFRLPGFDLFRADPRFAALVQSWGCPSPERTRPMIGQALSHYRIAAAIGAGGMGEVYRATDPKLGREVAIKVLPQEFAADPERLARFEREAKVLASLDHSGIAHLYGFESAALPGGTSAHVLVMELVGGRTWRSGSSADRSRSRTRPRSPGNDPLCLEKCQTTVGRFRDGPARPSSTCRFRRRTGPFASLSSEQQRPSALPGALPGEEPRAQSPRLARSPLRLAPRQRQVAAGRMVGRSGCRLPGRMRGEEDQAQRVPRDRDSDPLAAILLVSPSPSRPTAFHQGIRLCYGEVTVHRDVLPVSKPSINSCPIHS